MNASENKTQKEFEPPSSDCQFCDNESAERDAEINQLRTELKNLRHYQYFTIRWVHSYFEARPELIDRDCEDQCFEAIRDAKADPNNQCKLAHASISEMLLLGQAVALRNGAH